MPDEITFYCLGLESRCAEWARQYPGAKVVPVGSRQDIDEDVLVLAVLEKWKGELPLVVKRTAAGVLRILRMGDRFLEEV